jgi:hypothetical protein
MKNREEKCKMKVIINKNGGQTYTGNILFRVYEALETENLYAFEVLCKPGFDSKYRGQYTCEHPQGAQNVLEKLLNESQEKNRGVLELSNELNDILPTHDHEWFECAIKNALKGLRKYN